MGSGDINMFKEALSIRLGNYIQDFVDVDIFF